MCKVRPVTRVMYSVFTAATFNFGSVMFWATAKVSIVAFRCFWEHLLASAHNRTSEIVNFHLFEFDRYVHFKVPGLNRRSQLKCSSTHGSQTNIFHTNRKLKFRAAQCLFHFRWCSYRATASCAVSSLRSPPYASWQSATPTFAISTT